MLKEKLIVINKRLILLDKMLIEFIEREQRFNPDIVRSFLEFAETSDKQFENFKIHSSWRERIRKQKI